MDWDRIVGKLVAVVILVLLAITTLSLGMPGKLTQAQTSSSLFAFVQTVQVTPDDKALASGFIRLGYVPALDRIVAVYSTHKLAQPEGGCMNAAHVYKVYTVDMQPTGQSGVVHCEGGGDSAELFVDNVLYDVTMYRVNDKDGWLIQSFDATTWEVLGRLEYGLDSPHEGSNDMMIEMVNGMLDVSAMVGPSGQDLSQTSTHHNFFTPDLQFLNKRILADTPHVEGSSMIFVDGTYYFITGNGFPGNVIVMRYDQDWNYLGMKVLRGNGTWSEGAAFDGQRFYVAYMDFSENIGTSLVPLYTNVHLATFDRDWNFIEELTVTNYTPADDVEAWRPWILLHDSQLYVSYDVVPHDPTTHEEVPEESQAYIAVYELNPSASSPAVQTTPWIQPGQPGQPEQPGQPGQPIEQPGQPGQPTGQPRTAAGTCSQDEVSPLGVLRSDDHGATWTSLGNACIASPTIRAVDPTPLVVDGQIVLYFMGSEHPPLLNVYRAASMDGVNFDTPQAVYTQPNGMADPFVLRLADGSFRLYAPSGEGILSASSPDGLTFTQDQGVRSTGGGMPGALLLPDGRVRLFLSGNGITSEISSDGLNFTPEGMTIPTPPDTVTDNPEPIRLADGSYLMLYSFHDRRYEGQLPWEHTEIHLATSSDGLNWSTNPTVIGNGGTSCVVETADGTLWIYYVNSN